MGERTGRVHFIVLHEKRSELREKRASSHSLEPCMHVNKRTEEKSLAAKNINNTMCIPEQSDFFFFYVCVWRERDSTNKGVTLLS